jgi:hypothetical protein
MKLTKNSLRVLLLITIVSLSVVVGSTLSARTDYEWPRFSMLYQIKGSNGGILTKRLTWFSKNDWVEEILSDQVPVKDSSLAPLNYSGAKYEFRNGEYIVYDPNTKSESRTKMETGVVMSPAEWLVPGYEEYLKQRTNFKAAGTIENGKRVYRNQEQRFCQKDAQGKLYDSSCNESEQLITEITFAEHGIPVKRIEQVGSKTTLEWKVIELKISQ